MKFLVSKFFKKEIIFIPLKYEELMFNKFLSVFSSSSSQVDFIISLEMRHIKQNISIIQYQWHKIIIPHSIVLKEKNKSFFSHA